jgi:two-component system, NarL family, invasion response regulator UvrY
MEDSPMRIYVVDAHPVFREGLKGILRDSHDITVVGEADKCQDLVEKVIGNCDVITLDGELDSLGLLQTLDKFRPKGRPPFTLILSRHTEEQHALQMLAAGADGYLDKHQTPQLIVDAIRKVARGGKYVCKELAETAVFNLHRMERPVRLSSREYQVLCLFASGCGVKQIAGRLSLSVKTVSTYRGRLLEKLNLSSNAQLIRYAINQGVLTD